MLLPENEAERLRSLHKCEILDTDPEEAFDELTVLAAQICKVPIALITLIDEDRQWFKSKFGWTARELPREAGFCSHTILQSGVFSVRDATRDDRFCGNHLVCAQNPIRFYAGIPVMACGDHAVGTLSVMHHLPRTLNRDQRRALEILGRQVSRLLEGRIRAKSAKSVDDLASTMNSVDAADAIATTDPSANRSDLLRQLSDALDRNELTMHFQPK